MIFAESARLYFRDFTNDDLEAMQDYSSDLEVVRFQEWGPNSLGQTRAFLSEVLLEQNLVVRTTYNLAAVSKSTGEVIGGVSVLTTSNGRIAIGFSLRRSAWGMGFGSECAVTMRDFALTKFNVDSVEATCDARNLVSRRILEKASFKVVRVVKNHVRLRDGIRDTVFLEYSE